MGLLERWQLKEMAKNQLTGAWGSMALRVLVIVAITAGVSFVLTFALMVLGLVLFMLSFGRLEQFLDVLMPVLMLPGGLLSMLASFLLYFGYIEGLMKQRCGEPNSLSILFTDCKMYRKSIPLGLLYLLASVIFIAFSTLFAMIPFIGILLSIALSVGAAYVLLRVSMCFYILVENPYTGVITAICQSWNLMRGHVWRYFVLELSFIGWYALCALTFGVLSLWISPYVTMTSLNFYYNLKETTLQSPSQYVN